MQYTKLGKTDIEVSRICLGCMGFGDPKRGQHSWTLGEDDSREIIRYALDKGINFFDTAIAYQGGSSEEYLGRALRDYAKREDVVIATKFTPRTQDEIDRHIGGAEHVAEMIDASLTNLATDYIDLYICHMWDYNTDIYEILDGLNKAVKSGKVRAIGISNAYAWQVAKANAIARAEGFSEFVCVQGHYNLIFREEEREMIPYCREENLALTPYSALAGGRLAKRRGETSLRLEKDNYARMKYSATEQADNQIIDRVAQLADEKGVSMTQIALAWLLTKVNSPIVGATKRAQIDGAIGAVDLTLKEEEIAYLEELYTPHALVGVMAQNTGK